MTHCWLCGASEIKSPNSKYTYYGKILGKKYRKQFEFVIAAVLCDLMKI